MNPVELIPHAEITAAALGVIAAVLWRRRVLKRKRIQREEQKETPQ